MLGPLPQPPEEGGGRFRSTAATYLGRRPERGEDEGLRAGPVEGGRPSVSRQGPEPLSPRLLMRESPVFSLLTPLKNVGAMTRPGASGRVPLQALCAPHPLPCLWACPRPPLPKACARILSPCQPPGCHGNPEPTKRPCQPASCTEVQGLKT